MEKKIIILTNFGGPRMQNWFFLFFLGPALFISMEWGPVTVTACQFPDQSLPPCLWPLHCISIVTTFWPFLFKVEMYTTGGGGRRRTWKSSVVRDELFFGFFGFFSPSARVFTPKILILPQFTVQLWRVCLQAWSLGRLETGSRNLGRFIQDSF